MAEETRDAQTVAEPTPETVEEPQHSGGSGEMTFDQWLDSNPIYRSEFDRRMTKGVQTARANWEQEQLDSRDEAKRLAKMTETQRERYQLDKDKAAFARQQAQFAAEQMRVAVGSDLQRRGLDAGFAKYLAGSTAEESQANLEEFQALWNRAISAQVSSRMQGTRTPEAPRPQEGAADPFLTGFSGSKQHKKG